MCNVLFQEGGKLRATQLKYRLYTFNKLDIQTQSFIRKEQQYILHFENGMFRVGNAGIFNQIRSGNA